MYKLRSTKAYRKAYKRVSRHKDFDAKVFREIVDALVHGRKLDAKYLDHRLTGEFKDYRECHIKNDILLVYQKHEGVLVLLLVNIGSHSSIF